jgi:dipeptidyl aminopeptidase/acylaminoacyl peptidase
MILEERNTLYFSACKSRGVALEFVWNGSVRYGGPGSQMVHLRFAREWDDYLACALGYIIVIVDGRGTGYKGRKLRNIVKDNLGFWETKDQINAAK